MYGKHFAQMYTGSMVGMGAVVFAVMGYVVSNQVPDEEYGSVVELNPKLLALILGEEEAEVRRAIERLSSPDPESRTPADGGRRLKQLGTFEYQVVNGAKYRDIRDETNRREQNRLNQAAKRERDRAAKMNMTVEEYREHVRKNPPMRLQPDAEVAKYETYHKDGNTRACDEMTAPKDANGV